jgi:hypothetical protein
MKLLRLVLRLVGLLVAIPWFEFLVRLSAHSEESE